MFKKKKDKFLHTEMTFLSAEMILFGVQNCPSVLEAVHSKFEQAQINKSSIWLIWEAMEQRIVKSWISSEYWKSDFNEYSYIYLYQNIMTRMNWHPILINSTEIQCNTYTHTEPIQIIHRNYSIKSQEV